MICLQHNPFGTVSRLKYLQEQKTEMVLKENGVSSLLDPPQRILWSYIIADRNSPAILFPALSTIVDINVELFTRKIFALTQTLFVHNCRINVILKLLICSI